MFCLGACATPSEPRWPPVSVAGLENYVVMSDILISGGEPVTEKAFAYLKSQGIQSILSVDGAAPKIELAAQYGISYFHAPFGYDGLTREEQLKVVRALQDAPKPVYVHCHHGKHRGPTAVALGRITIEGVRPAQAVLEMERIGTSRNYQGLYKTIQKYIFPTQEEVESVGPIPPRCTVTGFVESMALIDRHWAQLEAASRRQWTNDPAHPDIDVVHEALQAAEALTETERGAERPGDERDFAQWLVSCRDAAWQLEKALRAGDKGAANTAFKTAAQFCNACHAKYRN